MSKYEYFVQAVGIKDEKSLQEHLNKFGEDGWDLISVDTVNGFSRFVFKREIESTVGLK